MTTQVQLRGAVTATQAARTLAAREADIDTTLGRFNIHNGSTAGGIPHANYADIQKCTFNYAAASGTNALTATYSPAPAALTAGMVLYFKAAANNTTAVTFNPNGLGATNLKKISSGAKAALAADDIVADIVYAAFFDGTDFILGGPAPASGLLSVSQGDLNTSTGTFSLGSVGGSTFNTVTGGGSNLFIAANTSCLTAPGGEYGYFPQSKASSAVQAGGWFLFSNSTGYITGLLPFQFNATPGSTMYGQQRYVTSSPPFDLGDGEAGGFFFALVNRDGDLVGHYMADVPPWAYNGPTKICAHRICSQTGMKFRNIKKRLSIEEIMDGAEPEIVEEAITQKIKNADMNLIPHPFGGAPEGMSIVLLDPMEERIRRLVRHQNLGGEEDVMDALQRGLIGVDQDTVKRAGPDGVPVHKLKFKRTG